MEDDEILLYRNIIYVPNSQELRNLVLKEMKNVSYIGNLGYLVTHQNVTLELHTLSVTSVAKCHKVTYAPR
jgi:hypothetical protein